MESGPGIRNGDVRQVWLRLCKEGGKWTPDEVAGFLRKPRDGVARMMHNMASRAGQLKRYKEPGNRCSFGVTVDCEIPFGITVRELADAGVVREQ